MEKTKVDIANAKDSLDDEIEAIDKYTKQIAETTCPALKAILQRNLAEEYQHKDALLSWLSS